MGHAIPPLPAVRLLLLRPATPYMRPMSNAVEYLFAASFYVADASAGGAQVVEPHGTSQTARWSASFAWTNSLPRCRLAQGCIGLAALGDAPPPPASLVIATRQTLAAREKP